MPRCVRPMPAPSWGHALLSAARRVEGRRRRRRGRRREPITAAIR